MDAPKQGTRRGDGEEHGKEEHGKDDLRQGRFGRYEGGRDSDQDRQAKDEKGREIGDPSPPAQPDKERGGGEEE